MMIYLLLGFLGLVIFCWGVFYPVRSLYSAFLLPRWVIVSSWIISGLLYGVSVFNLLVVPLHDSSLIIKIFSYIGGFALFVFGGWIGFQIAEERNQFDYFKQIRNLEGQIKDIKAQSTL